jgi:transposase
MNNMAKLTKEQVLAIPELLKTKMLKEVAKEYNTSPNSISRWIKILRNNGVSIDIKRGRRPLLNKQDYNDDTDFILPRAEETKSELLQ